METDNLILENEIEIVERAKTDEIAFKVLYDHYFPKIYKYIFRRTGNREASEDIMSNVFLKAFVNLKKYENRGYPFGAWLYKIATNQLVDYYRRDKSKDSDNLTELEENSIPSVNFLDEVERKRNRMAIEKILVTLPERYSQIIQLRYFAELEIYEIAETLNIPKTHVSVLIHRALECFQKKGIKSGIKFYCFIF